MKLRVDHEVSLGPFLYRQFLTFRGGNSWFFKKECMGNLNMFFMPKRLNSQDCQKGKKNQVLNEMLERAFH